MNHCGSFQPVSFFDSGNINIHFSQKITFPLLSLLLGFGFNLLPWRQGPVHLYCQLKRRNLRVVYVPAGHSQRSTWALSQGEGEGLVVVILVKLYYHSHKEEHKV